MTQFSTALVALQEAHLTAIADLEEDVRRARKRIDWLENRLLEFTGGSGRETAEALSPPAAAHPYGPPDELDRVPMTPEKFSHACNSLALVLHAAGVTTAITSMMRNEETNRRSGATPQSKHRCRPMIATDYSLSVRGNVLKSENNVDMVLGYARDLGLWAKYHDTGSGPHLHTQGLPVGPIHPQWLEDWATEETKAWAAEVYS